MIDEFISPDRLFHCASHADLFDPAMGSCVVQIPTQKHVNYSDIS